MISIVMGDDIVGILRRVAKSFPSLRDSSSDAKVSQFRSPDLLLRSVSQDTLQDSDSDVVVARALFGDEEAVASDDVMRSAPHSPSEPLLDYLHRSACDGHPVLLRITYATVTGFLMWRDLRMPALVAERVRALLLGALADLAPVAYGLSARVAASLAGIEHADSGSGVACDDRWGAACRARASDVRGADAEDADIRVLLSATMHAAASTAGTPGSASAAVPDDISLPYTPELESKLFAHTPADRAALLARESLRDRTLGIFRAYRAIGSSFSAASWPEFIAGLPSEVAKLRPLLFPSNAPWFARLLLHELELFHAHELLGGPAVASDARLAACNGSDGKLQQLAERLSVGGRDAAPAFGPPTALRRMFSDTASGRAGLAEDRFPLDGLTPSERSTPSHAGASLMPPPPQQLQPRGGGVDLLQQRLQGRWSSGPPRNPAEVNSVSVGQSVRAALTPRDVPPRVTAGQAPPISGPLPAPQEVKSRPRARREPLFDASLRASAAASVPSSSRREAATGTASGMQAEGQALAASVAVVDALRLRGACRFVILLVLLLDDLHLCLALRLRVSAELRRSTTTSSMRAVLAERCEQSLLPHAHRSRAHAQVLAALDLAPLIVAAQSAFRSDAVAACGDFREALLSVDCLTCLRMAASNRCLASVVPWVSQYVYTAAQTVPVDAHSGLRETHRLLVEIAAEAQCTLLFPFRVSTAAPDAGINDDKMAASAATVVRNGMAPCVAFAIVAMVEHLSNTMPDSLPPARRCVSADALRSSGCGDKGRASSDTDGIDGSAELIGHRFLAESCPSLRSLHEFVRRRAATTFFRSSEVATASNAPCCTPVAHAGDVAASSRSLTTPSKSRPLAGNDVESHSAPATPMVLYASSTDAELAAVASPDPTLLLSGDASFVSSPRMPLLSPRKIQPTLLSSVGPRGEGDGITQTKNGSVAPLTRATASVAAAAGLLDPTFRADLNERFYRQHPHHRRLVYALAEASAAAAVKKARQSCSLPSGVLVNDPGALSAAASEIALARTSAAIRSLFADVAAGDCEGALADTHAVDPEAVQRNVERGIVLNLCAHETEARVRQILQQRPADASFALV